MSDTNQSIIIRFSNKKNANHAKFYAHYIGLENAQYYQSKDFRSDYAFNDFNDFKSFKKAVTRYAKNPNAVVEFVSVDNNSVELRPEGVSTTTWPNAADKNRSLVLYILKMIERQLDVEFYSKF